MATPRLALLVVGEGPARPGLEAELGIADRVRFTGLAEREAVPGYVAGSMSRCSPPRAPMPLH